MKQMEYQPTWPKSSLNLSMPRSHMFPKMEQIQPMNLSYTPPPQENTLENSEENRRENTQNQNVNYDIVHQIQQPIPKLRILNFHVVIFVIIFFVKNDLTKKLKVSILSEQDV
jgi:hypothetical protein